MLTQVLNRFDQTSKDTFLLRSMSFLKIPLLALCAPKVIERSKDRCVVRIKRSYWSKNHVGSVYFGALCMGAELSVAATLVFQIQYEKIPVNFLFTAFTAEFTKKATGDVYFVFDQVSELQKLIDGCLANKEKASKEFFGKGYLNLNDPEPIMTYSVTIHLKNFSK